MFEPLDPNRTPFGLIYLITNNINGSQYVGQTVAIDQFKWYWGSGKILMRAMKKNGRNAFTKEIVLYAYENQEELDALERFYIKEYNTLAPNGYNIEKGGGGPRMSPEVNAERKKKISEKKKGVSNVRTIGCTDEVKKKIGQTHSDRNLNDPDYRKMVEERGALVGWNREVKYRSHIPVEEIVELFSQGLNILNVTKIINEKYGTKYASGCLMPKIYNILGLPLVADVIHGFKSKPGFKAQNCEFRKQWAIDNPDLIKQGLERYRALYPMPDKIEPKDYR